MQMKITREKQVRKKPVTPEKKKIGVINKLSVPYQLTKRQLMKARKVFVQG